MDDTEFNDFIAKNRTAFDQETPLRGHFDRFEERLAVPEQKIVSKRISLWKYTAIAASFALVVMSMVAVYFYGNQQGRVAQMEYDVNEMKEKMILSLIENQSPSKRLKAVNYIDEYEAPVGEIIIALINTLHHDDNSNVRLATAKGLEKFADRKEVRLALSSALILEEDPSVQIQLINILVSIKEKAALQVMEKLLNKAKTPDFMKEQLKAGISKLI